MPMLMQPSPIGKTPGPSRPSLRWLMQTPSKADENIVPQAFSKTNAQGTGLDLLDFCRLAHSLRSREIKSPISQARYRVTSAAEGHNHHGPGLSRNNNIPNKASARVRMARTDVVRGRIDDHLRRTL